MGSLTSNVFKVGLNIGFELNVTKEVGILCICPTAGLGGTGLTVTALWQLYARGGSVRVANGGWKAASDG